MRIRKLEIDGFGVWSGLKLADFEPGLNVFYGPNEAGKTTLLEFIRSAMYGFSERRRARYLPPVSGGTGSGSLWLDTPSGLLQVRRVDDHKPNSLGAVSVRDERGNLLPEGRLYNALRDVDEATYNHIYALGLRELQELATLDDLSSADLLYKLTTGLDRVSLLDVIEDLAASRQRLIGKEGTGGRLLELVARRDEIERRVKELSEAPERYSDRLRDHDRVKHDIDDTENRLAHLRQEHDLLELALAVQEPWRRRQGLDEQIEGMGKVPSVPDGAVARVEKLQQQIQEQRQRGQQLKGEYDRLRAASNELDVNDALWKQAPWIESLAEGREFWQSIEKQLADLETEAANLRTQVERESARMGLTPQGAAKFKPDAIAQLKPLAHGISVAKQKLDEARGQLTQLEQSGDSASGELQAALKKHQAHDLTAALEEAGQRVSQLRKRIAADEKLEQHVRKSSDLEEEVQELYDRQMLPNEVMLALGGVFAVGIMCLLLALFTPLGIGSESQLPLTFFGVLGIVLSCWAKLYSERTYQDQRVDAQRQWSTLRKQIEDLERERDQLDKLLPKGGGPLSQRLQAAEAHLQSLEQLVPLESKRHDAHHEVSSLSSRVEQAAQELEAARKRWTETVGKLGLPANASLKHVTRITKQGRKVNVLQTRLDRVNADIRHRRELLEGFSRRTNDVIQATGLQALGTRTMDRVRQLHEAAQEQREAIGRRKELRRQAAEIRKQRTAALREMRGYLRQRDQFLQGLACVDEKQLRLKLARFDDWKRLCEERNRLVRELTGMIAGKVDEDRLAELLSQTAENPLEDRWRVVNEQLAEYETQLTRLYEKRGQLSEQIKTLVDDRRLASKQLEASEVRQQLALARDDWRVRAVASRVLAGICEIYQRDRQPQVLREASSYLQLLTEGEYVRVWTPLGERSLLVDDAQGNSLRVDLLSSGTREQLFLALRLSLIEYFSRQGVKLPVVMDDLLVNFDDKRARRAAIMLRDFALQGHQLLVFSCHEHICRLFQSLQIPVRTLPSRRGAITEALPAPQPLPEPAVVSEPAVLPEPIVLEVEPEPEPEPAPRRVEVSLPEPPQELEVVYVPAEREPEPLRLSSAIEPSLFVTEPPLPTEPEEPEWLLVPEIPPSAPRSVVLAAAPEPDAAADLELDEPYFWQRERQLSVAEVVARLLAPFDDLEEEAAPEPVYVGDDDPMSWYRRAELGEAHFEQNVQHHLTHDEALHGEEEVETPFAPSLAGGDPFGDLEAA